MPCPNRLCIEFSAGISRRRVTMQHYTHSDKNSWLFYNTGKFAFQEWLDIHKNKLLTEAQYKYVENISDFSSVDVSQVEYLMDNYHEKQV
jgi:hypothetical protein